MATKLRVDVDIDQSVDEGVIDLNIMDSYCIDLTLEEAEELVVDMRKAIEKVRRTEPTHPMLDGFWRCPECDWVTEDNKDICHYCGSKREEI